jgi:predicted nucleic acid-binding protein
MQGEGKSMNFVIDNSIVMFWCFEDESSENADRILEILASSTAFTPSIWPLEVGNVLFVAERKNRITHADSTRFLALLAALPIVVEQESPNRMLKEILSLAREYDLSSYDASYLDLAMRKGVPIATTDKNLIKAADRVNVSIL